LLPSLVASSLSRNSNDTTPHALESLYAHTTIAFTAQKSHHGLTTSHSFTQHPTKARQYILAQRRTT
jgi:hypothetical protein